MIPCGLSAFLNWWQPCASPDMRYTRTVDIMNEVKILWADKLWTVQQPVRLWGMCPDCQQRLRQTVGVSPALVWMSYGKCHRMFTWAAFKWTSRIWLFAFLPFTNILLNRIKSVMQLIRFVWEPSQVKNTNKGYKIYFRDDLLFDDRIKCDAVLTLAKEMATTK